MGDPLCSGLAQDGGLLREYQPKLGQQAADAVDASRALGLEAFAQTVNAQHALLLDALDGHEMHLRARGGFADGARIIGVVFATLALQPLGRHQVRGDDASIQPQGDEPTRPMVCAGACFHGDEAAGRPLRAPGQKFVAGQRPTCDPLPARVKRVNLNDALCQISANSCNLGFLGLLLSKAAG